MRGFLHWKPDKVGHALMHWMHCMSRFQVLSTARIWNPLIIQFEKAACRLALFAGSIAGSFKNSGNLQPQFIPG
jgi:hypothetical protein